jgi:hypothetical protein
MPGRRQINNGKTSMTERDPSPHIVTFVIGPAMPNSVSHIPDNALQIEGALSRNNTRYAAHLRPLLGIFGPSVAALASLICIIPPEIT